MNLHLLRLFLLNQLMETIIPLRFKSDYMKSKDLAPEKKYEFEKDGLFWRFKSLNHRNY